MFTQPVLILCLSIVVATVLITLGVVAALATPKLRQVEKTLNDSNDTIRELTDDLGKYAAALTSLHQSIKMAKRQANKQTALVYIHDLHEITIKQRELLC